MTELEQLFFHNKGYELITEIEDALTPKNNKSEKEEQRDKLFLEKVDKELNYKTRYKIFLSSYPHDHGELYTNHRKEALSYFNGEKSIDTSEVFWDYGDKDIEIDCISVRLHSVSLKNPTKEAQIRIEEELKLFNGKG